MGGGFPRDAHADHTGTHRLTEPTDHTGSPLRHPDCSTVETALVRPLRGPLDHRSCRNQIFRVDMSTHSASRSPHGFQQSRKHHTSSEHHIRIAKLSN